MRPLSPVKSPSSWNARVARIVRRAPGSGSSASSRLPAVGALVPGDLERFFAGSDHHVDRLRGDASGRAAADPSPTRWPRSGRREEVRRRRRSCASSPSAQCRRPPRPSPRRSRRRGDRRSACRCPRSPRCRRRSCRRTPRPSGTLPVSQSLTPLVVVRRRCARGGVDAVRSGAEARARHRPPDVDGLAVGGVAFGRADVCLRGRTMIVPAVSSGRGRARGPRRARRRRARRMMGAGFCNRSARGARDRSRARRPTFSALRGAASGARARRQFGTCPCRAAADILAPAGLEVLLREQPRDLERVRGGALARVLDDEEQVEPALLRAVLADAARRAPRPRSPRASASGRCPPPGRPRPSRPGAPRRSSLRRVGGELLARGDVHRGGLAVEDRDAHGGRGEAQSPASPRTRRASRDDRLLLVGRSARRRTCPPAG